ncbi:MAG: hypothetical protein Q7J86_10480, partial [Bacteroidota bacterium]|nr:hypothetical protein [Bacteroidota bacterium]
CRLPLGDGHWKKKMTTRPRKCAEQKKFHLSDACQPQAGNGKMKNDRGKTSSNSVIGSVL